MRCPTCEREIRWSEQFPFRPFCSERCRLVDLGAWLSGQRAIAGESLNEEQLGADRAADQDAPRPVS